MSDARQWRIAIGDNGVVSSGFAPSWFLNPWTYYGNEDQASDMLNIDIIDPNVLTQGPRAIDLTGGNETGLVNTLVGSILKIATSNNISFAVGGNRVYRITPTAVSGTPYPLIIDKATVTDEIADDLTFYRSAIFVFYNHSGNAGDIARVDLTNNTIAPAWGSTVPTGMGTLQFAPHYAITGGDDSVYFTNGRFVGRLRGTTLTLQGLDFWENSQAVSVSWNHNRAFIAVNRPNIPGANFNQSGIYRWNGITPSWEGDPIEISGRIGALYTKNGITYVWWQDENIGHIFGRINGLRLEMIKRCSGVVPNQSQVGEFMGFISWVSNGRIFLWGAREESDQAKLFQYCSPRLATAGAIAAPFGEIIASSMSGTNFSLARMAERTTNSNYKTKVFNMKSPGAKAQIGLIQITTEPLGVGALCDVVLRYNQGKFEQQLERIVSSTENPTVHKLMGLGPQVDDFQLDFDFTNGDQLNPVKIRSVLVSGHWVVDK